MKDEKTVIKEFNDVVNMTVPELEKWLKSSDSKNAGWSKDDGGGESVGHDSGRKIIKILQSNPKKEPRKYTGEQIKHMRKVVSYCKRHLAQEQHSNNMKSAEEVKKTKSYASLKNWGHDPLKARTSSEVNGGGEDRESKVGQKRKRTAKSTGANKRQETAEDDADSSYNSDHDDDGNGSEDNEAESDGDVTDGNEQSENKKTTRRSERATKGPKPGDTVSWNWGQGQPKGKVLDVKAEDTTITTKRGSKVSRKGTAKDPAVVLDTGKSKGIKLNHELND